MNEGPIRADEIQSYLALLHGSLGGSRAPVSRTKLREFYDRQNYTGMVKLIRDGMKLDLRVRVALVTRPERDRAFRQTVGCDPAHLFCYYHGR